MPITQGAAGGGASGGGAGGMSFPSINLPSFNFQTPSAQTVNNPSYAGIMQMLTQQPTSAVNTVMPGLEQILGLQSQTMMPYFQSQTGQMMATAQSNAQQRGLTGSSIEQAGILGAQSAGQQNMNQFLSQQLGQLGSAYTGLATADVNTQNQMYQNIAQAMGQQMSQQQTLQMFQQQMQAQSAESSAANKSGLWGSVISGAGNLFSDERLKIEKVPLGKVNGLTLYSYEYKQDTLLDLPPGKHFGFMAQEVEKKWPSAVMEVRGFKAIDLVKFLPLMAEAGKGGK